MPEKHNIAPDKLELVMAVVHNSKAAYYSSIIGTLAYGFLSNDKRVK